MDLSSISMSGCTIPTAMSSLRKQGPITTGTSFAKIAARRATSIDSAMKKPDGKTAGLKTLRQCRVLQKMPSTIAPTKAKATYAVTMLSLLAKVMGRFPSFTSRPH